MKSGEVMFIYTGNPGNLVELTEQFHYILEERFCELTAVGCWLVETTQRWCCSLVVFMVFYLFLSIN